MDEEEEVRIKRPSGPGLQDLSGWSVAELEAYIARLELEMARAREEIENKDSVRSAAEALFKKS